MARKKKLIIIFILSIIVPIIGNILLIRVFELSLLILIPLYIVSGLVLIRTIDKLTIIEGKKKSRIYKAIVFGSALLFILTYGLQVDLSIYIYYQKNKTELKEIVDKINNSNITIMTDNYENINGYPVNNWGIGKEYPLDSILTICNINKQKYEDLRRQIISIGCSSLSKTKDGIVFFEQGGMMDSWYGIAYSPTGKHPNENNEGRIVEWKKITNDWYSWSSN